MKREGLGVSLLAVLVTAFIVMGGIPGLSSSNVPKPKPTAGDRLYVAMQQDMPNFNYFDLGSNSFWKANVIAWCFGSLSGLDFDGTIYPAMAESLGTLNVTNLEVTVTLRQGVKFHDGTTCTADDVIFSYTALREGTTVASAIVDAFDADGDGHVSQAEISAGVIKVDDTHIKFKMAKPYGQFFLNTLGVPIIPKHIWQSHLDANGIVDVTWGTEPAATIGTGPFKYKAGDANVYRLNERFEDFWGKDFTTPSAGKKIYPAGVTEIYYKIYANIDTAILALESGEVDYITWALTAGKIPEVQANPNTDVIFMPENGYFYLAFNQKKEPANNIKFREAVSHCIDKASAVQRYMGGYGVEGDSSEPPFWTQWYNSSVQRYAYDTNKAKSILDAAGFVDSDGDGWRNMPDGRAIEPITLITPPADYDPIRIKIGTALATELRGIGLDVTAKPVNFDTLVAKMCGFDYTMLELGWALSADPIGNVFDILGPTATQNYFAFWSAKHPNPYYSSIGGVSTLADAETQAYADQVYELGEKAKKAFERSLQIKYTKEAQGIISKAIPVNVLYYRVAAEGYRVEWTGWTPFMGSLFNTYTLASLTKGALPGPGGGTFSAILNAPSKVYLNQEVDAKVLVVNKQGIPLPGVPVQITSSGNCSVNPSSGNTDTTGQFTFKVKGETEGYATLTAKASIPPLEVVDTATVVAVGQLPKTLYINATPSKLFMTPGESVTITLKVVDELGNPVSGATVSVDKSLMKYGSLNQYTVTTDTAGAATMTYAAPATSKKNEHMNPTLTLDVTKAGYTYTCTCALNLIVYNPDPSDWHTVSITDVSRYAMNATNPSTTITIKAGNNEKLYIIYSNKSMLSSPPSDVTTNAAGTASVTLTFNALTNSAAERVTFKNKDVPNSISDTVTLLYNGTNPPATNIYGGLITFAQPRFMGAYSSLDFTLHLYDINNNTPSNVDVSMLITATQDGSLAATAETTVDSGWDYAGMVVTSVYDETNIATSGPFIANMSDMSNLVVLLDSWFGITMPPGATNYEIWENWTTNEYGVAIPQPFNVNIVNGSRTFTLSGQMTSVIDRASSILVLPDGDAYFNLVDSNWHMDGNTTISTDFVNTRCYEIVMSTYGIGVPVIETPVSTMNSTYIAVKVVNQTNAPVDGASVKVYEHPSGSKCVDFVTATGTTDSSGGVTLQVKSKTNSAITKANIYVKASVGGTVSIIQSNKIVVSPVQMTLDLTVGNRVEVKSNLTVDAVVKDRAGTPMVGANVSLSTTNGTLDKPYVLTDSAGKATFTISTSGMTLTTDFGVLILSAKVMQTGYLSTGASAKVEVYKTTVTALPPTTKITKPAAGTTVEVDKGVTTSFDVKGWAASDDGVKEVYIKIDGGSWTKLSTELGTNVSWTETASGLGAGDHTFTVKAVSLLDKTSETSSVSVTVKEKAGPAGIDPIIIGAVLVIIIIILLAVVLLMKKKKPAEVKEAPPAEEKKEEKPEEKPTTTSADTGAPAEAPK